MQSPPLPTPDELIDRLARAIAPSLTPDCALVGIHTGGVWVMDALLRRLARDPAPERGVLDISFYRDDFSRIGLHPQAKPSSIPFAMEGRAILLIDDVLHTGRTVRAAMNLLFDYGRPAAIRLAVLVDRGGRELPLCADHAGLKLDLPPERHISLEQGGDGGLHFIMKERDLGA